MVQLTIMENNKTIALFGGTGFVGSQMRRLLLEEDYGVRMLARPGTVLEEGLNLHIVHGDLSSGDAIEQTLKGADAVIVMTGPRTGSIEDMNVVVEGTRMIVEAMQTQGIKRLIKLSGVSVRLKGEPFPLPRRLLDIGLGLAMKYPSQSKYLEQDIIESSSLNWTVVRPPVISKKSSAKSLRSHEYAFLGMTVSVHSLCQFFLDQIDLDEWVKKSPVVGQ